MAGRVVELDRYTGLRKGSSFQSAEGTRHEPCDVIGWCRRVEQIGTSAAWTQEVIASHAALALYPGSPAENWYRVETQKGTDLTTWNAFRDAIKKRFTPPVTATQRVQTIRGLRQNKG